MPLFGLRVSYRQHAACLFVSHPLYQLVRQTLRVLRPGPAFPEVQHASKTAQAESDLWEISSSKQGDGSPCDVAVQWLNRYEVYYCNYAINVDQDKKHRIKGISKARQEQR